NAIADAANLRHSRDPNVPPVQSVGEPASITDPLPRHWITEEAGYLTLSQGGTTKLRLPLYLSTRLASTMTGPSAIGASLMPSGSGNIPLSGSGVCTGTLNAGPSCTGSFPTDEVSLVSPFELQVLSPRDPTIPANADLQYAGVATDGTNIWFGLSTWGD